MTEPKTTLKRSRTSSLSLRTQRQLKGLSTKEECNPSDSGNPGINDGFCPLCQMPFSILRVQTPAWHMEECVEVDRSTQKECSKGCDCDSTIVNHYLRETHLQLAKRRSGLDNCCATETSEHQLTAEVIQVTEILTEHACDETLSHEKGPGTSPEVQLASASGFLNSGLVKEDPIVVEDEVDEIPASSSLGGRGLKRSNTSEENEAASNKVLRTNLSTVPQAKITSFFRQTGGKPAKSSNAQLQSKPLVPKANVTQLLHNSPDVSVVVQKEESSYPKRFRRSRSYGVPKVNNDWSATETSKGRSCPFYKKLQDVPFAVDAFNYGAIPGITAYFLSHFHSDHYVGLNSKFQNCIYCSQVTANLLELKLRVNKSLLRPLPLDIPRIIQGVEVTLLEANHCPGAVMFLFRYQDGRVVLHTGDFRANTEMEQHPALESLKLDLLYLDTTYCQPQHDFPNQQEVLNFIVALTNQRLEVEPNTLIVCGSYTIGKEKVFIAIAQSLRKKVWASREKCRVLRCLEDPVLQSILTQNQNVADIHVISMFQLNFKFLQEYLRQFGGRYSNILALKPTGWENGSGDNSGSALQSIRPQKRKNITIYGIPYSEHSSYSEMKRFVQFVRPARVIPTVNVSGAAAQRQTEILRSWTINT